MELRWDRWLNLVYYFATRNASTEDKQKFDTAIQDYAAAWYMERIKPVIAEARQAPPANPRERTRRMPPRPAGWADSARATFDNKAALQTLTAGGVSGKARRR